MALIPPPIGPGSRLAAFTPSGVVGTEEVRRGANALETLGFEVEVLSGATAAWPEADYLGGRDEVRAGDAMEALTGPWDGAICTRGGSGAVRILPLLDFEAVAAAPPRPLVGFSDVTALQTALWQRCGLLTFSGPQLARGFGSEGGLAPFSRDRWLEMLGGRAWEHPLPQPEDRAPLAAITPGTAEGTLLGGNLMVLAGLAGTPWQPSFEGAVVVLEEIDEPPYRLDRALTQLALAGCFQGARGVLLGQFLQHTREGSLDHTAVAARVLREVLPATTPLLTGAPYGHVGPSWTLPLGARALLDGDAGTLTLALPR